MEVRYDQAKTSRFDLAVFCFWHYRHRNRDCDLLYDSGSEQGEEIYIAGVSKATGRQLKINGDLKLDLGWISEVRASQIQFENARWSKHPQMVEVGLVDVQVDLWQLLSEFRVVLPTVTISQAKVILEKNADGSANWEFGTAPAVTGPVPEKRTEFPVIEKLIIKDGTFLFANRETKNQLELKLTQAEAAGFLDKPVKLKAEGTYQKQPLTLSLEGGSYQNLRSAQRAVPSGYQARRRKSQSNNRRESDRAVGDERGRRHA